MSKLYRVPDITMPLGSDSKNQAIAIHLVGRLFTFMGKLNLKSYRHISTPEAHIYGRRLLSDTKST